jgi:hypothetical protein
MKKMFVLTLALVCVMLIMGTASFRAVPHWLNTTTTNPGKCVGYTIIAFDQGVDCSGDTIRLVRKNGYAERVRDQ